MPAAIYRAMANQPRPVAVPHSTWKAARAAGVELPPSPSQLPSWRAHPADGTLNWMEATAEPIREIPSNAIVVDEELGSGAEAMLEHAVGDGPIAERLVRADQRYTGFAWYDRQPKLTRIGVEVREKGTTKELDLTKRHESRQVDAIWLVATIQQAGEETTTVRIATDAAVGSSKSGNIHQAGILLRKEFRSGLQEIREMVEGGLFVADDDYEESAGTQHDTFCEELEVELAKAINGAEAATEKAVRQALQAGCIRVPEGREARVVISDTGKVKVSFDAAA